jgi:poly(A) polymerase
MTSIPDAPWRSRPGMDRLLAALDAKGGATRFVGGSVRDALLGLEQSDVDLATRFTPDEVVKRLEAARIKAVPTGIAHGTITAVSAGNPVEVTTLRRDVSTDGRRATVAFTDDWRADAARRDFTINALSADPLSGEVFDYFDGLADLEARRVRFIGDPLQRIAEDHLRILRFFRFHARFGAGVLDAAGLDACVARANDLMALSRERIADELLKLLALPDPGSTVRLMIARGIFRPVLPEIESADRLDALIVAEREAGIGPAAIRRLAALLPVDPQVAAAVAARLRLSNKLAGRLVAAAGTAVEAPAPLAYRIGAAEAIDRTLLHGQAGPELKQLDDWRRPQLPVSGGDLIAMGLIAGPIVAKTMQALEEEWVVAGFPTNKAEVRAMARRLVDQALRSSQ